MLKLTIKIKGNKMSILNLESMTTAQKFMAMEELWEDMSRNVDTDELTPQWHLDILDEREKEVQSGEAKFENFDDVKKELIAQFS